MAIREYVIAAACIAGSVNLAMAQAGGAGGGAGGSAGAAGAGSGTSTAGLQSGGRNPTTGGGIGGSSSSSTNNNSQPCAVTGRQSYNLIGERVIWSMKVGSAHQCLRGVRFSKVQFERMSLVSPPLSGQVTLQASSFTYIPKKNYRGRDSFDLEVVGQIQKIPGTTTIHVDVSVESELPAKAANN
jgi:hypothetical protein